MKDKSKEHYMDNDFQKIIGMFKNNYLLFIITAILFLGATYVFNKIATPKFRITSQVLIKNDEPNSGHNLSEALNFNILGTDQSFNNELLVIKSIPVVQQSVKNLNLNISYYTKKYFYYPELYTQSPFKVIPVPDHPQPVDIKFELVLLNDSDFIIRAAGEKISTYNFAKDQGSSEEFNVNIEKHGRFNHLMEDKLFSFIIKMDPVKLQPFREKNSRLFFEFHNTIALAQQYQALLNVNPINEKVTSAILTFEDPNSEKGTDFLNEIGNVYISNNLEKKNHLAKITIEYIDKMLGEVSDSLSSSEQALQQLKTSSQVMDVSQQSVAVNQQLVQLENQRSDIRSKIRYYAYVKEHLEQNKSVAELIIPSSIGINDATLSSLITQLAALSTERSTYVDNNQLNNPQLKLINGKIENIKNTIYQNIDYLLKTLEINNSELQSRYNTLNAEINKLPVTQRQMLIIERKFKLNDAIYTFLQERRAEASITMASNIPSIEIIEPAVNNGLVFPKKTQNMVFALIMAIIIPLIFLTIREHLRSTFGSYDEVIKYSSRPLLGKILHTRKKAILPSQTDSSSPYLESLRLLRTNLDFFIRDSQRRIILVTSSTENEGKSFTAYNLALSFTLLRKSVILVTFDLRKPSHYPGLAVEDMIGLTAYYIGKATMEDIIVHTDIDRLDIIPAGNLPPNPAELIELEKTKDILQYLKQRYDYIILDTPPIYYFTDTFLLMKHADVNLLVIRHNISNKNIFSRTIHSIEEKNIPNLALVYNDIPVENNFKYGYKYYQKKSIKKVVA